jgi:hypothetical protein
VKIIILRLTFAAVFAAGLSFAAPASRAGTYGDERWCAVHDEGSGVMTWDCEFVTVDDCTPAILAGNKGFCALNPYWRPPDPSTNSQR